MYQAIVFLPLLGAIIAGLIALAGAVARHPGGRSLHGAENTAHDSGPHHGGGAPSPHASSVLPHTGHEDHPHEPPAARSRSAELVTTVFLFAAMALSWIAFAQVGFGHSEARIPLLAFVNSGDLKFDWALRIDTLTAVMLVVVTTISALVHL